MWSKKPHMTIQKSILFLWEGVTVYCGLLSDNALHKHHAAQICFGLDGPFQLMLDGKWVKVQFALLPANHSHQLIGGQGRIFIALLDGAGVIGRAITKTGVTYSAKFTVELPQPPNSIAEAKCYIDKLLTKLPIEEFRSAGPAAIDKRIEAAISFISNHTDQQITAETLASTADLSQSRFLHLFSQHTGLPLRRFVLWRRIISSIDAVIAGDDLTKAAHMGGFSDSAHFSRTFKETFGLSPSIIFKNSRNIQVII